MKKYLPCVLGLLLFLAVAGIASPAYAAESDLQLSALQMVLNELETILRQLETAVASLTAIQASEANLVLESITQNLSGINVTIAKMVAPGTPLTLPVGTAELFGQAAASRPFLASPVVQAMLVTLLSMVGIVLFSRRSRKEIKLEEVPAKIAPAEVTETVVVVTE